MKPAKITAAWHTVYITKWDEKTMWFPRVTHTYQYCPEWHDRICGTAMIVYFRHKIRTQIKLPKFTQDPYVDCRRMANTQYIIVWKEGDLTRDEIKVRMENAALY